LKVLEDAKLITRSRDAQWRPAKLDPEGLMNANAWIAEYKKFWEERFDRLDAYMGTVMRAHLEAKQHQEKERQEKQEGFGE
jgi:DNA-binding transcriptional ArsR family regulator